MTAICIEERDSIISKIDRKQVNSQNITFDLIKRLATNPTPPDVHNELDRGHAILSTQDQLNKYLFAYGSMVKHQWTSFLEPLNLNSDSVEIIDYACGQGLASMLFFDRFRNKSNAVKKITLIEPSEIAMRRAKSILECYAPQAKISTINKRFDDIGINELHTDDNAVKIHLFSNIIDIEGFDIVSLFNKVILNKGKNHFIVLSSDRSNHGGSKRLDLFFNCFKDNDIRYKIIKKSMDSFVVENPSPHPESKDFNVKSINIGIEA